MSGNDGTQGRLEEALAERDRALEQLARARVELDALKLSLLRAGEEPPPLYPNTAAPGLEPPLRYVLVDALNDRLKQALGAGRALLRRVRPGGG
jgi:hypothetical protein